MPQLPKQLLTLFLTGSVSASLAAASGSILPDTLPKKQRREAISSLLNWKSVPGVNLCDGHFGQPKRLDGTTAPSDFNQTTTITSTGPNFLKLSGISTLNNHVIVKQPGREVHADIAHIHRNKAGEVTQIDLRGKVHLYENGKHMVTDHLNIKLPSQKIRATTVIYHLTRPGETKRKTLEGWGTATKAWQDKPTFSTYEHATYTTCRPSNPTWTIQARKLTLDQNEGIGTVYHGVLRLKGFPVFPLPFFQFPIDDRRRTGFLTPTYSYEAGDGHALHGNITNFILTLPYYINLAPNYDDLLNLNWWSRRGFVFDNHFRYINQYLTSNFNLNVTPHDDLAYEDRTAGISAVNSSSSYPANAATQYINGLNDLQAFRWRVSWDNTITFNDRWNATVQVNAVSDNYYFRDYSHMFDEDVNLLTNNLLVNYVGDNWTDSLLVEKYQVLHRFDQMDYAVDSPYERQPELIFTGFYSDWLGSPLDLSLSTQLDNYAFEDPFNAAQPAGTREHARAELAYPIDIPNGVITPEVYMDMRSYQLSSGSTEGYDKSKSYAIPMFDLDSQLTWASPFHSSGQAMNNELTVHTYYVYIPTVNQDDSPNFDGALLPYSYEQLFVPNRYSGYSRLSNANQVSLGLQDRILDSATGTELASLNVGLANAFTTSKVCLTPGCDLPTGHLSPLVTDLKITPLHNWSITTSAAWYVNSEHADSSTTETNTNEALSKILNNATGSIQYNDDAQHVFSVSYSYAPAPIEAVPETFWLPSDSSNFISVGAGWPITERFRLMGYYSYDLINERSSLGFFGIEYNACCWRLKLMYRRLLTGTYYADDNALTDKYHRRIMFTFEFKGLGETGKVGSTYMKTLEGDITNYDPEY
jgi:LPS-assembly protein